MCEINIENIYSSIKMEGEGKTAVDADYRAQANDFINEFSSPDELRFLNEFRMITGEEVYNFPKAYLTLKEMSGLHLEELDKLECDLKMKETMSLEAHKNLTKDLSFKERFNVADRITFYKDQSWKNGIIQDIKDDEICIIIDGTDYPICIPLKNLDLPCINIPDDQFKNLKRGNRITKYWSKDKVWYTGKILKIIIHADHPDTSDFTVRYDDGDLRTYYGSTRGRIIVDPPSHGRIMKGFYKVQPPYLLAALVGDSLLQLSYLKTISESGPLKEEVKNKDLVNDNQDVKTSALVFSPDGLSVAAGFYNQNSLTIKIWNVLHNAVWNPLGLEPKEIVLSNIMKPNNFSSISVGGPDNSLIAFSVEETRSVCIWSNPDVNWGVYKNKPQKRIVLQGHTQPVNSVAFSSIGENDIVASASSDKTVKIWSVTKAECIHTVAHTDSVSSVAFNPKNGNQFVSASHDKSVRLWNISDLSSSKIFTGHTESVLSVTFSPDGKLLASGSIWDVKIWDVEKCRCLKTLKAFRNKVDDIKIYVSFSPDSNYLASGSNKENTIRVWNVKSGIEIHKVDCNGKVNSVAFYPSSDRWHPPWLK